MANNIFTGFNVAVAKQTIGFIDAGISVDNIVVIYLIQPQELKSYDPARRINALTGFTAGQGYYIVAKADIDLSGVVSTTLTDSGSGSSGAILLEGGDVVLTEG